MAEGPRPVTTSQEVTAYWSRQMVAAQQSATAAIAPGQPTPIPDEGITVEADRVIARIILTTPSGGLATARESVEMRVGGQTLMRFWVAESTTELYDVGFRLDEPVEFVKSAPAVVAVLVLA